MVTVPTEMLKFIVRFLEKSLFLLVRQGTRGFIGNRFLSYATNSDAVVETIVVFPVPTCDLLETALLNVSACKCLRECDCSTGLPDTIAKYCGVILYTGTLMIEYCVEHPGNVFILVYFSPYLSPLVMGSSANWEFNDLR